MCVLIVASDTNSFLASDLFGKPVTNRNKTSFSLSVSNFNAFLEAGNRSSSLRQRHCFVVPSVFTNGFEEMFANSSALTMKLPTVFKIYK